MAVINRIIKFTGCLLAFGLSIQVHALERSSQQVNLRTNIIDTSPTPTRDLGFSFYIGTNLYRQGNDNLQFVNTTLPNGNVTTANIDTNYRPGLTLGGAYPFDSYNAIKANLVLWNHTDRSNRTIDNIAYNGSAKLNYYSFDLSYGNNNLFKTRLCRAGLFGGLIYANADRIVTNNMTNLTGINRTRIDNSFSGIGPFAEGVVSIRPFVSNSSIIFEGDARLGLLYNNRDATRSTAVLDPDGNIISNQIATIGRSNSGTTYVRVQAGAYFERNFNGSNVRFGGGWQARQYQNGLLEVEPVLNNNLNVQGPFLIVLITPKIIERDE